MLILMPAQRIEECHICMALECRGLETRPCVVHLRHGNWISHCMTWENVVDGVVFDIQVVRLSINQVVVVSVFIISLESLYKRGYIACLFDATLAESTGTRTNSPASQNPASTKARRTHFLFPRFAASACCVPAPPRVVGSRDGTRLSGLGMRSKCIHSSST